MLILHSPHFRTIACELAGRLGDQLVGVYEGAAAHVPIEAAEAVRAIARDLRADCCIAIGVGSTLGLAKAFALDIALPIIAVPTTFAGSEMTPIWGLTERGETRTGRDQSVRPRTVSYDPRPTLGLPLQIAGPSGMNALTHCVEALYAPDLNPRGAARHGGLAVVIGVVNAMAINTAPLEGEPVPCGGIASSVTVFGPLIGPLLLVVTPLVALVALVGWARWRVGAHTAAQAVVAIVLDVVITVGTV
jgi:Iron-containing alcohol dehydrogenase